MIERAKKALVVVVRFLFKRRVAKRCKSYIEPLKVHGLSTVTKNTVLGRNVNFNGLTVYGGGNVTIGDNFHSGGGCQIIAQDHNYEGKKIPYDETYVLKDVVIEDNVWLGNRVIVLGGVTIGEGAIIQAGSVVVGDIEKYAIAGGHPAKVFSKRDVEHYLERKRKKLFH